MTTWFGTAVLKRELARNSNISFRGFRCVGPTFSPFACASLAQPFPIWKPIMGNSWWSQSRLGIGKNHPRTLEKMDNGRGKSGIRLFSPFKLRIDRCDGQDACELISSSWEILQCGLLIYPNKWWEVRVVSQSSELISVVCRFLNSICVIELILSIKYVGTGLG